MRMIGSLLCLCLVGACGVDGPPSPPPPKTAPAPQAVAASDDDTRTDDVSRAAFVGMALR